MRQALMGSFPEAETASCYRIGHVREDLEKGISEANKLIIGHIDFRHLNQLSIPDDYQLLTMLRHPIERIISTYIHFQTKDHPDYTTWKGGKMDFEEFMETEFARNWYCRLLAGISKDDKHQPDERELEAMAHQNFKRLHWVGVSEQFEDSLLSLQHFTSRTFKLPGTFNTSQNPELHQQLRRRFRSKLLLQNAGDLGIYMKANYRLKQQIAEIRGLKMRRFFFNLRSRL